MSREAKFLALVAAAFFVFTSNASALRKSRVGRSENYNHSEEQMDRLRRIMMPLLRATDHQIPASQIRMTLVDDSVINAATGGNGRYYVTTGLLRQATDDQLRGVLAHEIAHEDLGHPAKLR